MPDSRTERLWMTNAAVHLWRDPFGLSTHFQEGPRPDFADRVPDAAFPPLRTTLQFGSGVEPRPLTRAGSFGKQEIADRFSAVPLGQQITIRHILYHGTVGGMR